MSAHSKGLEAATEAVSKKIYSLGLWWLQDTERALEIARDATNAYYKASNPVGLRPSETIYDDFYRLRAGARLVLMRHDEGKSMDDVMEGLRGILISQGVLPKDLRAE